MIPKARMSEPSDLTAVDARRLIGQKPLASAQPLAGLLGFD